jgi:hypothetical protein
MKINYGLYLPFKLHIKDGIKSVHAHPAATFMLTFGSYMRETIIDRQYLIDALECTIVTIDFMPKDEMVAGLKKDEILRLTVLNSIHFMNRFIDALRISHEYSHNNCRFSGSDRHDHR